MIELTLTELAVAVMLAAMLLTGLFAWISRWSRGGAERAAVKSRVVCRLCLAVFEDTSRDEVLKCPACGAKTGRGGPQPLG